METMASSAALPVAQYLRMSTEHQQYSTVHQSVAILQYAQDHNMEIVRTYADHGKSGLGITTRLGLKQLLREAVAPDVDFRAVLVYDVSRWGRFQNPDQAASYEYLLQAANIPIHYCAESFQNDGSLASAILKTVKRGMAGEYSRELSTKVWLGHRRITELGFKIGGYAGYGLRRQLVTPNREFKQMLKPGERKNLQSEHVILVPGPPHEIKVIHQIYDMYIDRAMTERDIARELNREGVPWIDSKPWTRLCVRHILTNPKYIGASVYNRTSCKLQTKRVQNPRNEWIWRDGAFEPVVSAERFSRAHEVFIQRACAHHPSTKDILDGLKALIEREGRPTERLIDRTKGIPNASTYASRFGSLRNAYALAGWQPDAQRAFLCTDRAIREMQSKIIKQIIHGFSAVDGMTSMSKKTYVFTTIFGIALSLVVTRCSSYGNGRKCWHVQRREDLPAQFHLVARLTQANDGLLDFFLFPNGIMRNSRLSIGRSNADELEAYRFDSLLTVSALLQSRDVEELIDEGLMTSVDREVTIPAAKPRGQLEVLQRAMAKMFLDEDFRNLLRAQGSSRIPDMLWRRLVPTTDRLALVICREFVVRLLNSSGVRRFIERKRGATLDHLLLDEPR